MKKVKIILLSLCVTVIFTSCARSEYTDEKRCEDICKIMTDSLDDSQKYYEFDKNHIELYFDDTDEYDDHYAIYSADTNDINEIGVFHAPDSNSADDLAESCREYIENMQENSRSFIASYAPEELSKFDAAEVRKFGNYVIYTVLPEDKAETIFEHIKGELKK